MPYHPKLISFLLFFCFVASLQAQPKPDVIHYRFEVTLQDEIDMILMKEQVRVMTQWADSMTLDLTWRMKVSELRLDGQSIDFVHEDDLLIFPLPETNKEVVVELSYSGVPVDGLIISSNKFGKRTMFSDHWPDRAHDWLAVVDHPTDKATCEFIVTAPDHYEVVSNGLLQSVDTLGSGQLKTHWKMDFSIPTKVMAMGVADFDYVVLDSLSASWLYQRYKTQDVNVDFAEAVEVRETLIDLIGIPYPFDKLDHVESTTVYGGMENAGCIFYNEGVIKGKGNVNVLIAHEIAHQWFGNSASESDWQHVWLSEGFATYYEWAYLQEKYGLDSLRAELDEEEQKILAYEKNHPESSILYQEYGHLKDILNMLTYEKAGWMLRMLAHTLGQDVFDKIVLAYYDTYKYGNASSQDFINIAEQVSGKDLAYFFRQWLEVPGSPDISYTWKYKRGELELSFKQHTAFIYKVKIDIPVKLSNNTMEIHSVMLTEPQQTFKIKNVMMVDGKPNIDPLNLVYGLIQEN